jgi:hypothetical protein
MQPFWFAVSTVLLLAASFINVVVVAPNFTSHDGFGFVSVMLFGVLGAGSLAFIALVIINLASGRKPWSHPILTTIGSLNILFPIGVLVLA